MEYDKNRTYNTIHIDLTTYKYSPTTFIGDGDRVMFVMSNPVAAVSGEVTEDKLV